MPASDPACTALGIPARLHWLNRQVDQEFSDNECLYVRFRPDVDLVNDKPPPGIFNPDEQSSVRQKLSDSPADVLYNTNGVEHFFTWGIAELQVGRIRSMAKAISEPQKREFTFKVVHVPERCWYPHTEIHVFENGIRLSEVKPRSVRTWIRDTLAEGCRLRKHPGTNGQAPEAILA